LAPDTTAPIGHSIPSPAANATGWNNTDVMVNWAWSDETGGSGIDVARCPTTSISSSEDTLPAISFCKDYAGNTGYAAYPFKVDKTAPSLDPIIKPNPAVRGGQASVSINGVDERSGIASERCSVLDTSRTGERSVTCTVKTTRATPHPKPSGTWSSDENFTLEMTRKVSPFKFLNYQCVFDQSPETTSVSTRTSSASATAFDRSRFAA
jgi:hypothetical protein